MNLTEEHPAVSLQFHGSIITNPPSAVCPRGVRGVLENGEEPPHFLVNDPLLPKETVMIPFRNHDNPGMGHLPLEFFEVALPVWLKHRTEKIQDLCSLFFRHEVRRQEIGTVAIRKETEHWHPEF